MDDNVQPPAPLAEAPASPPRPMHDPNETLDGRPTLRKLLREQGVTAYPRILETLAPYISPQEASAAQEATGRAIKVLNRVLLGLGSFALLPFDLPYRDDLLAAACLVSALVLVSRFRVPFAGRLLLVPGALLTFHMPTFTDWNPVQDAMDSLPVLLLSLILAALVDFGASTEPGRLRVRIRPWALSVASLAIFAAAWEQGFWITCAAALLGLFWGWWPRQALERQVHLGAEDADTLWMLAMRRWSFVAGGRFLAVTAGLIPFLLFLHSIDLEKRLVWSEDDPEILKTEKNDETHAWFWQPRGTYLQLSHLRKEGFYGWSAAKVPPDLKRIEDLVAELDAANLVEGARSPAVIYMDLRRALKPYRILTAEQYNEIRETWQVTEEQPVYSLHGTTPPEKSGRLYHLEKSEATGLIGRRLRRLQFLAEDLTTADLGSPLRPVSESAIRDLTRYNDHWQWLLLGFGLLGFTILWRRGGDSRLGRWIGLWFIAAGSFGTLRFIEFFLPAINYQVSHHSMVPAATLLNLLVLATFLLVGFFVCFLSCAVIWTHACWPTARPEGPRRRAIRLRTAFKVSTVTACMLLLFYVPMISLEDDPELATAVGILLFPLVSFGLGLLLRWRTSRRGNRVPISLSAGFLLLLIQAVVVTLSLSESEVSEGLRDGLQWANLGCGLLFLLLIVTLIFRKDFLHLSAVRDFSFVLTAMVVPVMLALGEELSASYVSFYAQDLLSSRAKEILAAVLAVSLLPPMRKWVERRMLYVTQPGLKDAEERIQNVLEELIDPWHPEARGRIETLLREIGFCSWRLYVRQGKEDFRLARLNVEESREDLEVSGPMRKFLSENRGFLDLHRLAFEWRYFFFQFELYRIRKATGARFLLPICLGRSVRALLFVPEEVARGHIGEPLAMEVAPLGLIAAQLRLDKPPV